MEFIGPTRSSDLLFPPSFYDLVVCSLQTASSNRRHTWCPTLRWNTLQLAATHYSSLQHTATRHTAPHCTTIHHPAPPCTTLHLTAPHCTTLHHTAPPYKTLHNKFLVLRPCKTASSDNRHTRYPAIRCNTLQHTATHWVTLHYTALRQQAVMVDTRYSVASKSPHCNILQHTATQILSRTVATKYSKFSRLWGVISRLPKNIGLCCKRSL